MLVAWGKVTKAIILHTIRGGIYLRVVERISRKQELRRAITTTSTTTKSKQRPQTLYVKFFHWVVLSMTDSPFISLSTITIDDECVARILVQSAQLLLYITRRIIIIVLCTKWLFCWWCTHTQRHASIFQLSTISHHRHHRFLHNDNMSRFVSCLFACICSSSFPESI